MKAANEKDRISNKQKKPAIERLKLLKTIDLALQRTEVCSSFIDKDGLNEMADWLL